MSRCTSFSAKTSATFCVLWVFAVNRNAQSIPVRSMQSELYSGCFGVGSGVLGVTGMEVRDYKGDALLNDGILNGLGVSTVAHMAVFFLALFVSWVMPAGEAPIPLCTVSLLTLGDLGSGLGGGEEGLMSKGNGEPNPAGGSEDASAVPEHEAVTGPEPEPERPDAVYVPKVIGAPPLPPPVHKATKKPKEKPKPAPKPTRVRATTVQAESPPSTGWRGERESTEVSNGVTGGHGEGSGLGSAEGTGKGNAGDGPGAGSGIGSGSGAGQGPFDASFGPGDGPGFLSQVRPKYPRFARERGKEGTVLLRLTIDERGRLIDVEVLKPAGFGFDEEAVRSVRSSSFRAARRNGKPVICRAHLPIRFVLRSKDNRRLDE